MIHSSYILYRLPLTLSFLFSANFSRNICRRGKKWGHSDQLLTRSFSIQYQIIYFICHLNFLVRFLPFIALKTSLSIFFLWCKCKRRRRKSWENRFCARAANYLWNLCKFSIKFQFPINYLIRSRFNVSWELWPFAWLSFEWKFWDWEVFCRFVLSWQHVWQTWHKRDSNEKTCITKISIFVLKI